MNKTKLVLLLLITLLTSHVFSQKGDFNKKKYPIKTKIKIWVEKVFSKKDDTQNQLEKAMKELDLTKTKLEEQKKGVTPTESIDKKTTANKITNNWTDEMIAEVNRVKEQIAKLYEETQLLNPFNKKDKERISQIEAELTNLVNKKIIPFKKIEMQIDHPKILTVDYSFETGKANLNKDAVKELSALQYDWEKELEIWKNYKDGNGEQIFTNDNMEIRINIIGYADMQGKGSINDRRERNRELSEKRAENVRKEIKNSLKIFENKSSLKIEYITLGKGEELPPNVENSDLIDNPARRIVIITTAIYPHKLLEN
jgi:hypothetical protein